MANVVVKFLTTNDVFRDNRKLTKNVLANLLHVMKGGHERSDNKEDENKVDEKSIVVQ